MQMAPSPGAAGCCFDRFCLTASPSLKAGIVFNDEGLKQVLST
ncbi:hypothetical protein NUKP67_52450 [Klebsiella variicola]|nr:hypothetical protein NUKP67_52450 [Klebsiella variicola]